jgi:hypothetical protein
MRLIALVLSMFLGASAARADAQLLMAEEPGCMWCAQWNAEVGQVYAKTGEGQAAPLRRFIKTGPVPEDITLSRAINFTPTFVLLVDGAEVGRIEGYPGEDFFWGLLGALMDANNVPYVLKQSSGSPDS